MYLDEYIWARCEKIDVDFLTNSTEGHFVLYKKIENLVFAHLISKQSPSVYRCSTQAKTICR